MKLRAHRLGAVSLLVLAGVVLGPMAVAEARMHAPYRGHRIVPANVAPLDGFTTPVAAYSFRKLRTAYAGFAVKLQRVDTTTQDIGFIGSDFDVGTAAAFCTTACTVNTLYDQSGNSRHLVQATAANQPAYVANCQGSLPCLRTTALAQALASAGSLTPATGNMSLNAVGRRNSGTGNCRFVHANGTVTPNRFHPASTANLWSLVGGTTGSISVTVADTAMHAGIGIVNGASSLVNIDGVETTGSVTGSTTAGVTTLLGAATTSCDQTEVVVWDNYVLTPAERMALVQNQLNYWAPYTLDAFAAPGGAYSFRKLKSSYSGPGVRIRRASDNAELDINFLGFTGFTGAPIDTAAANAHCAATTCTVVTLYDQSGNARHLTQAVAASQPALVFGCQNGLPCIRAPGAQLLVGPSMTPATGVVSLSIVARRTAGTGVCVLFRENTGNRILTHATAGLWQLQAGSVTTMSTPSATEGSYHAMLGIIAGAASSILRIDGTEGTAGTGGTDVVAGTTAFVGAAATTCELAEAVFWDNYVLTAAERPVLVNNQRSFWGF